MVRKGLVEHEFVTSGTCSSGFWRDRLWPFTWRIRMPRSGVDPEEAELLATALGSLGGVGARWTARLLGHDVHEVVVKVNEDRAVAWERVLWLLDRQGQIIWTSEPGQEADALRAIVGSGAMNLNPAVVTVEVCSEAQYRGSRIEIRAVAKEGVIKQRAGRKAAERLAASLTEPVGPQPT
jgi:hypothetical protein